MRLQNWTWIKIAEGRYVSGGGSTRSYDLTMCDWGLSVTLLYYAVVVTARSSVSAKVGLDHYSAADDDVNLLASSASPIALVAITGLLPNTYAGSLTPALPYFRPRLYAGDAGGFEWYDARIYAGGRLY